MKLPAGAPWTDVAFAGVYWQEQERLPALLDLASRWFTNIHIGVQTNDPEHDETLAIARRYTDNIIVEPVQGYAEPTLNNVVARIRSEWTFVVSGDEMPSERLLSKFQDMVYIADHGDDYSNIDGFWISFVSTIEGVEYQSEQDRHLRLFRSRRGWPSSMHSRPHVNYPMFWPREDGVIYHDRTLDEMIRDYLRYLRLSNGNDQWAAHNRLMIHDAVTATAQRYSWELVEDYGWWPEAKEVAFDECIERCGMHDAGYDCKSLVPA
jgi:hypothetical protein